MTESKLNELVTAAAQLKRLIATHTENLKVMENRIKEEAASREEEHLPSEHGDGQLWQTLADDGTLVRVSFPAPTLKATIDPETKPGQKLIERIGRHKDALLTPKLTYTPVDNFRDRVREFFSRADAKKIIEGAESKSSPRLTYETKEAV